MPTTMTEAQKILAISQEYLTVENARELFRRLHEEVGQHSDNDSVKESMRMMSALLNSEGDKCGENTT